MSPTPHRFALPGLLLTAALGLPMSAVAQAPAPTTAPGRAFPQYASAEALQAACDSGLTAAQRGLRQLERRSPDRRWLGTYDAFNARLEDASNPITFLSAVHPDKAMRDASEACELRWNDFFSAMGQNEALYRAARRLRGADAIDRELLKTLLEGFEDAGVALPPAARARAKQINDRMNALGQTFARNVRDANTQLSFTEAELHGVPLAAWQSAPRDAEGRVLLGLAMPTYTAVMQGAEQGATRERIWRAKNNEGGEANLAVLDELVQLRKEYASLFGAASWAEFVLRRRMAETPAKAQAFLDQVKSAVQQRELRELAELRQAKAAHLQQALQNVSLARWDVEFYSERIKRERYSVDEEGFRQYFPPEASLQFTLRLVERLLGVRYQRIAGAPAWHPEVQTYAVSDAASGRPLATLWVDLYPREGKYNHAAVWGLRASSTALQRVSQAALVVNFNRQGLTLEEMETLLHELGHAVHNNLSATRHTLQAGTSVKLDFAEAPSQMLEDWVLDAKVLQLFAEVCSSCKPVPEALLAQAVQARHYGKGVQQSRQQLYASYDLALYGAEPRGALGLWAEMEGATPLGHVPGTMMVASFGHIASGYSAGYYGYLWSLVVAMDLRSAFAADKLDAAMGRRYRDSVLAPGSQRPPQDLVRAFLGRDFNADAFFADLQR